MYTFNKTLTPADPMYYGKCSAGAIANSTHHRRFHETAIPLHAMLYVLGQAREREDVVAAEIAHDKNESMFIISTRSEKQISRGYAIWWWVFVVLGLAIAMRLRGMANDDYAASLMLRLAADAVDGRGLYRRR